MKDPRIDRKALKRPDGFVERGRRFLDKVAQDRRFWLPGLALVAVVVGGYYAYEWWSSRQLTRDWNQYFQANDAKDEERIAQLKKTYENGGSTRAAFLAAVTIADYYSDAAQRKITAQKVQSVTGKTPQVLAAERAKKATKKDVKEEAQLKADEEATKDLEPSLTVEQAAVTAGDWYTKALKFSFLQPAERELLALNMGNTLELQNKWDEALAKYKSVVALGGAAKPLAMLHAGRMHEHKNEKDAAKGLYQSLSSEFGNTEYSRLAKNYLRRMDSPLFASPTKP